MTSTKIKQCEYYPYSEGYRFEFLSVGGDFGSLEYTFSAMMNDENNPMNNKCPVSYIYSEKTGDVTKLSRHYILPSDTPNDNILSGNFTGYIIPNI